MDVCDDDLRAKRLSLESKAECIADEKRQLDALADEQLESSRLFGRWLDEFERICAGNPLGVALAAQLHDVGKRADARCADVYEEEAARLKVRLNEAEGELDELGRMRPIRA